MSFVGLTDTNVFSSLIVYFNTGATKGALVP